MKNTHRTDRRVRKTQAALYLALAHIAQYKDLRSITVSELAEKADIHRATFYSHYSDIRELYEQIQYGVLAEFNNFLEPNAETGKIKSSSEVFKLFIAFIQQNKEVCRMLLSQGGEGSFYQMLSDTLEAEYINIFWNELKNTVPEQELSLLANYHIQGCLAVISRWAENGYKTPAQIIENTLVNIDTHYDDLMISFRRF